MHDGKRCDVGQISIYSPQIKGTYAAISVTEDTGQNSQLYNSAMSPRCNKKFKWAWLHPQGAWDAPHTKRHN